ncbi:hypothetical protein N431DRAFT_456226 [Stipitochalara longipes BDJ]|nr:hypothetical protein N431DRAFT_456226 [Stipitochalara longipes BDJ]
MTGARQPSARLARRGSLASWLASWHPGASTVRECGCGVDFASLSEQLFGDASASAPAPALAPAPAPPTMMSFLSTAGRRQAKFNSALRSYYSNPRTRAFVRESDLAVSVA